LANPIPAHEAAQKESETPQPNERKIVIETLDFEAATQLPNSILDDLTALVKQREIRKANRPISVGELAEEVIREFLQEQGYSAAKASAQAQFLGGDPASERYSLSVRIDDIRQFWLGDIQFREANPNNPMVFSSNELRELIPLGDGDVFNIKKLREGIEALSKFYGSHGYINFTATPALDINGDRQRISVVLELEGGSQFRVRDTEVLGLDTQLQSLLKSRLIPGEIFNPQVVADFYKQNKSLLPADSSQENLQVRQDPRSSTVDLVFDFGRCPTT
jgi:outer membrane protein assembly factor BamA